MTWNRLGDTGESQQAAAREHVADGQHFALQRSAFAQLVVISTELKGIACGEAGVLEEGSQGQAAADEEEDADTDADASDDESKDLAEQAKEVRS